MVSGRDLDPKPAGEVEALIGTGLAKSMNVKVGDGLTLLAITSDGALNGVDVQIVGIVNSGIAEMDARYLRISSAPAQRLLQSDRVTNLVVGLDSTENTDRSPATNSLPASAACRSSWYSRNGSTWPPITSRSVDLFNGIFLFLGVIVFFMVLMSSVNTLLMAMFERTREIGTMLAMGTPRLWVVALFMLEATLLGMLGAIVGVVGGNLLGALLELVRPAYAAASGLHRGPLPSRFSTCPA